VSEDIEIVRLIRSDLAAFVGYRSRKPPGTLAEQLRFSSESVIKLDANENPYGCSPRVTRALACCDCLNTYYDASQTELRGLIEGYVGVGAEHIVAGNGSCELIDLLVRLFVAPGDEVICCVPTFMMYRFSTQMYGGRPVEVRRSKDFAINVDAVRAAINPKTKMILIDNPNNPGGILTSEKDILRLADTGLPLLVDEAYFEFGGETVAPLVSKYPNLMVLRTFSKWAGLAGLRIGYGLFPPQVADCLLKVKLPYNMSMVALIAVRESLKDRDYLMNNVRMIIKERERLFAGLQELGFLTPMPSRANFILCSVQNGMANKLQQGLQKKGIQVRYFDAPLLADYIRISVGKPEHTDALIPALREVWEEING